MFDWGIAAMQFSGGESVWVGPGTAFILIGPNNGGKSTALRNIYSLIRQGAGCPVVTSLKTFINGTGDDFHNWMTERYPVRQQAAVEFYYTRGGQLAARNIPSELNEPFLRSAHPFLIHQLETEDRLQLTHPRGRIDIYTQTPEDYIHVMQADDSLAKRVSSAVRASFERDLIINWGAGSDVHFHVGDEPERTLEHDRVSAGYLSQLNRLPRLESEGDGIRSFVGTLLAAMCGSHKVLLIDEPEAFLHPPQARRLASMLASSATELRRQVIIATHSSDVVRGAISGSTAVAVCRITRDGDKNHVSVLQRDRIRELWSRPLLRSSAAFDGLFHEGVIVCEGDADCRFYEAALRYLETSGRLARPADLHFVHGGGKGQLPYLTGAYSSLGTRTAVVADIDLLRDKPLVSGVLSALNANLGLHESLFNTVHAALAERPPIHSFDDLKAKVDELAITNAPAAPVTNGQRRDLFTLITDTADWSEPKKYGTLKLRGGAKQAANELLDLFADIGLFLVPTGQLESWWREGPSDKSEWATAALRKMEESPSSFSDALAFMTEICSYFGLV